jgi:hypothetical protein
MSDDLSNPKIDTPLTSTTRNWWEHAAAFSMVVVELCWILPWYRTLVWKSELTPLIPAGLILGVVMLAAYGLAFSVEALRLLSRVQNGALAILLFISIIISERLLLHESLPQTLTGLFSLETSPSLLIVLVIWLWWRGLSLARKSIHPDTAWRRFELGLGLFMLHIFVAYRLEEAGLGLGWFMFFLLAGFLSVLLARISSVVSSRRGSVNPFDLRWLAGMSGIIALSVLIASALGYLLTGQGEQILTWLGKGIRSIVTLILFIAAIPAILLAFVLGPLMQFLGQMLPTATLVTTPTILTPGPYFLTPQALPVIESRPLSPLIQALIFWGVLTILIVFLLLRLRSGRRAVAKAEPGKRESLLRPGEARKLMRKAFEDAIDGWMASLRPVPKTRPPERIRQIYVELLEYCAGQDTPRAPQQTPLEFLPLMQGVFEDADQELALITQVYLDVRYGGFSESGDQIATIESAWKRVRSQIRQAK